MPSPGRAAALRIPTLFTLFPILYGTMWLQALFQLLDSVMQPWARMSRSGSRGRESLTIYHSKGLGLGYRVGVSLMHLKILGLSGA